MKLDGLFKEKACPFAIEVFPPKRTSPVQAVYGMLDELREVPADYISVTYSAGGSGAKEYTAQIAGHIRRVLGIEALAHLTCVCSRREDVAAELHRLRAEGVENILALRGDKMPGEPAVSDYAHASDLAGEVKRAGDFYLVGACYPEGHPESASLAEDIDHLRIKLDAGVGHLVTQMFFDNGKFFRFMNLARKKGIGCPVEAGVMPITRPEQISRVVALSSASPPAAFSKWVSRYSGDAPSFYRAGIHYAVEQLRDLIESGADGIHLYAMNNPAVAKAVYEGVAELL